MNNLQKIKLSVFLILLLLCDNVFVTFAQQNLKDTDLLFKDFCKQLSEKDLLEGSYIKTATDFYAFLLDHRKDTTLARIVILTKSDPLKNKLYPDITKNISQNLNWPYHSFIYFDGKVYDPIFSSTGIEPENYLQYFSKNDPNPEKIMVFSFQIADAIYFLGKDPESDMPRLKTFESVNLNEFLEAPYKKSQRKKK